MRKEEGQKHPGEGKQVSIPRKEKQPSFDVNGKERKRKDAKGAKTEVHHHLHSGVENNAGAHKTGRKSM